LIRGNTVVTATAALGAVVTGGLMATQPTVPNAVADAAEAAHPQADLAAATHPLAVRPVSDNATITASDVSHTVSGLLAVPSGRETSVDKHDLEALHKGEKLAAEAASLHAQAVKDARVLAGGGDLDDWISVALSKLGLDQSLSHGVKRIIMAESRGNPHAVNHTDSNALAGRPSQGLMQVIPSTFRAYVLPEFRNRPITDPVANITAGVRYMIANYGISTVRAGGRHSAGSYIGY
jgi:soluble lytic murein transglycosylase-like protein